MQAVRLFDDRACELDYPTVVAEPQRRDRRTPEKMGEFVIVSAFDVNRKISQRTEVTKTNAIIHLPLPKYEA
jgi:hypothetical protein